MNANSFWPNPNPTLWNEITNNKKVFLIGPASYTLNYNRSHILPKFDLISRCNHSIPVHPKNENAIGRQTDLYYNNLYNGDGKNRIEPSKLYFSNVKMLIGAYPYIHPFNRDIDRYYTKREGGNLPFRVMATQLYNETQRMIRTRPNTGILALMDLITSPVDFVYLTGFTFFSTGTTYHSQAGVDQSIHLQEPQKELVRYQACYNPKLIVDMTMREILWKKEFEWLKLQWTVISNTPFYNEFHSLWKDIKVNQYCWAWNQKATLYEREGEEWVVKLEIEPMDLPDNFNPFVGAVRSKTGILPDWIRQWWVIQLCWLCDVIYKQKRNPDSYLIVPWVFTESKLFDKAVEMKNDDILLWNKPFFRTLIGMHQAIWISNEKEFQQLYERKDFFG